MLTELFCDKFTIKNSSANPIRFHKGLNLILGPESAKNSIGKSTMLQIIDFAFGGNDYLENNMLEKVGHHTIFFAFDFDGNVQRFSRSTDNPDFLSKCNEKYEEADKISQEEYLRYLSTSYQLAHLSDSFRNLVGSLFRIYKSKKSFINNPIQSVVSENGEKALIRLIKLFDKYKEIESHKIQLEKDSEKKEAYSKASSNGIIVKLTQKQIEKKEAEKCSLQQEIERMEDNVDEEGDINIIKGERAISIKSEISRLRYERLHLKTQQNLLQRNDNFKATKVSENLASLQKFFPTINMEPIHNIEIFHKELTKILKTQVNESSKNTEAYIALLDNRIVELKGELKKLGTYSRIKPIQLQTYADKKIALKNVESEIKNSKAIEDALEAYKTSEKEYQESFIATITPVLDSINLELKKLSPNPPELIVNPKLTYTYKTNGDEGSGTNAKGVLLFHLALLKLTQLPLIIHDSYSLKQIENESMVNLLNQCDKTEKQVFAALDKIDSYSDSNDFKNIIERTTVIELSEKHKVFANT